MYIQSNVEVTSSCFASPTLHPQFLFLKRIPSSLRWITSWIFLCAIVNIYVNFQLVSAYLSCRTAKLIKAKMDSGLFLLNFFLFRVFSSLKIISPPQPGVQAPRLGDILGSPLL